MVKWLDMAVIAEGVETLEQADYLKSIGCFYVQGYFYARPMTSQDYEKRFIGSSSERTLECIRTVRNLRTSSFWDPDSLDSFIFNKLPWWGVHSRGPRSAGRSAQGQR